MKFNRDNRYANKMIRNISALFVSATLLCGCGDGNAPYEPEASTDTPAAISDIEPVASPESTIEPTPAPTPEPTPEPTIELIIENENIEINEEPVIDDSSELIFKRLSEEEEAEEMKKYETYDDDEINDSNLYFSACFLIEGKPKVIFGYV